MPNSSFDRSRPITLTPSTEMQTYLLVALAMALTVVGAVFGMVFSGVLFGSGLHVIFLVLELGLILSSSVWINRSPLNFFLFALFPLLSGFTIAPYILMLLTGYVNGASILLNALGATVFLSASSAILARFSGVNLGSFARAFLLALVGVVVLGIFQIFIPTLQTGGLELFLSGAGIVIFAFFLAYDLQRIADLGRAGANPFMLALSLYLDIFNLFLSVVRFMVAISGRR